MRRFLYWHWPELFAAVVFGVAILLTISTIKRQQPATQPSEIDRIKASHHTRNLPRTAVNQ